MPDAQGTTRLWEREGDGSGRCPRGSVVGRKPRKRHQALPMPHPPPWTVYVRAPIDLAMTATPLSSWASCPGSMAPRRSRTTPGRLRNVCEGSTDQTRETTRVRHQMDQRQRSRLRRRPEEARAAGAIQRADRARRPAPPARHHAAGQAGTAQRGVQGDRRGQEGEGRGQGERADGRGRRAQG